MRWRGWYVVLLLAWSSVGCALNGADPSTATPPIVVPDGLFADAIAVVPDLAPDGPPCPTYSTDIAPLVLAQCGMACHRTGGNATPPLDGDAMTSYQKLKGPAAPSDPGGIAGVATTSQTHAGGPVTTLSAGDQAKIAQWLGCGAPF